MAVAQAQGTLPDPQDDPEDLTRDAVARIISLGEVVTGTVELDGTGIYRVSSIVHGGTLKFQAYVDGMVAGRVWVQFGSHVQFMDDQELHDAIQAKVAAYLADEEADRQAKTHADPHADTEPAGQALSLGRAIRQLTEVAEGLNALTDNINHWQHSDLANHAQSLRVMCDEAQRMLEDLAARGPQVLDSLEAAEKREARLERAVAKLLDAQTEYDNAREHAATRPGSHLAQARHRDARTHLDDAKKRVVDQLTARGVQLDY